ncbi:DUF3231 family protein [Fredinandcohnia sp. QZ13]|uniref:DUF3231 family protein n=1 Tax=Fredinandcohnia sp. QZ13 TaxID=3073144 RepID=UPI0028535533|nr:DUF3231 family protein [Fredinandcohnia sp. QZ13]MDR4889720.1 DUF3231 family protein [Fredinandcohnia sp. QZ13]
MKPNNEQLTSAEMGKLWAVYMGNTMAICVLTYFQKHCQDPDIMEILKKAKSTSQKITDDITKIYNKENFPIPIGFDVKKDVNIDAPRLFADEFYLHYLKYTAKAGLSLYSTAIPMMIRPDIRDTVIKFDVDTIHFLVDLNETLEKKGYLTKPPVIPIPKEVSFVEKQNYLAGFFGDVRPLHALEIAHLQDNLENNVASKGLLMGFSQVAERKKVKEFMLRGKEITMDHIKDCLAKLHEENLPGHPLLDDLVEASTIPPFSDKLMTFHKIDMFSMKIRSYANAMSLNGRRDLGLMFSKFILDIGRYVEDGANIMIDEGWFEKPPHAVDRKALTDGE